MTSIALFVQQSFVWALLTSVAGAVVVEWSIKAVCAMSWSTHCGIRWAVVLVGASAFAICIGPLFGHQPSLSEGVLVSAFAILKTADRRRELRPSLFAGDIGK